MNPPPVFAVSSPPPRSMTSMPAPPWRFSSLESPTWTTTVFSLSSAIGLVPQLTPIPFCRGTVFVKPAGLPACNRFAP